jgi:hypothetical protein
MADDTGTAQDALSPLKSARKSDEVLVPRVICSKNVEAREAGTQACHIQRSQVWNGDKN